MTFEEHGRRLPACLALVVACVLLTITSPRPRDWLRWSPANNEDVSKWPLQDVQPEARQSGRPVRKEEGAAANEKSEAAAKRIGIDFRFHGNGSCENGYYTGEMRRQTRPAKMTCDQKNRPRHGPISAGKDSCMLACSSDPACTFIGFKKGITCSRFDATAGACRQLRYANDGYATYQKIVTCDWSYAVVQTGWRCSQSYEDWRGGSKEAMLRFCASTSFCKGLHWFNEGGDIRNVSKGWFQACTGLVSAGRFKPWSILIKPQSCSEPADLRPLTKVSVPSICAPQANFGADKQSTDSAPASSVDFVISAFNEDLSFVEPMMAIAGPGVTLKLYCSGEQSLDSRCLAVPNLGGENAVYLHHIVQNYDSLADITVFSVGSIMRNENNQLLCRKLNYVLSQLQPSQRERFGQFSTMAHTFPGEFNPFNPAFDIETYDSQKWGVIRLCNASVRPLGTWYQRFVDQDLKRPTCAGVLFNDIFAVRADRLRIWPRSKYEALLAEMSRCGDLRSVADHYMERSWKAMLDRGEGGQPAFINQCPIEELILLHCLQKYNGDKVRCPNPQGN